MGSTGKHLLLALLLWILAILTSGVAIFVWLFCSGWDMILVCRERFAKFNVGAVVRVMSYSLISVCCLEDVLFARRQYIEHDDNDENTIPWTYILGTLILTYSLKFAFLRVLIVEVSRFREEGVWYEFRFDILALTCSEYFIWVLLLLIAN